MANESKWTYATQTTLEASGAQAVADAFVQAADQDLAVADHLDYPLGDFVLACAFGSQVGANSNVALFVRPMNVDGTNDGLSPVATYREKLIGVFVIPNNSSSTSTNYYTLTEVPLVKDGQYWLQNVSDQTLNSGWSLKVTAKTRVPG
jgi:hypothetical protein